MGTSFVILCLQLIQSTVKIKKIKRSNGYWQLKLSFKGARSPTVLEVSEDPARSQSSRIDNDNNAAALPPMQKNEWVKELNRPKGETLVVSLEVLAVVGEVVVNLFCLLSGVWGRDGADAATVGLVIWIYICVLTLLRLLLTSTECIQIPKLWYHTAVLYNLQWLFTVLVFRSTVIHSISKRAQVLIAANFALVTILAAIAVTSRRGNKPVVLEYEDSLQPSREPLASIFSLATFGWVDAIVWQGYKKTYEMTSVWNLIPGDKAAAVIADYRQLQKTSKLAWHLLRYFRTSLLIQAMWAFLSAVFTFMPTLLLKAILEYVEDPQLPVATVWFYITLLTFSTCVQAITDGQTLWIGRKICIRLRAVIISEIYAKALRRKASAGADTILGDDKKKVKEKIGTKNSTKDKTKSESKAQRKTNPIKDQSDSQVNSGTIINLMAVDSFKVSEIAAYLHFLWISSPVLLIICMILLYRILGYSALASVGVMIFVMPLNFFIARAFARKQKIIMAATDARIHTTNEVLQNIRIIKYFAWEDRFGAMVNEKRRAELRAIRNRYILWTFAATLWFGIPLLITFFSFLLYTKVEKKPLKPSIAFTALSLFSLLRIPLDQFADMLAHVQETKVSVNRVEEFLSEGETEKYTQLTQETDDAAEPVIGFRKATFTWGGRDLQDKSGSASFRMADLTIKFHVGQLNVIAGPTGSGKTSLLMALLGEMTILGGSVMLPGNSREDLDPSPATGLTESIAYCAQQAWLVNDTIKQNILFASPWNEERYRNVLSACALQRDLENLDDGDSTLVGEKGITLSGGQKQRVSLARALYCNSRHVLLDDCLSAVDSETAKHLFDHCIMGPLMANRTCILVTHNIALCVPQSKFVVVMDNGKIKAQGSADEMMSSGALGDEAFKSKPASKAGTRMHSQERSIARLLDDNTADTSWNTQETNGRGGAPLERKPSRSNGPVESANTRTEAKAVGGVKLVVIKTYLAAMGPWYFWIIVAGIFGAQQIASVSTNVWIRQWANSYETEMTNSKTLSHELPMAGHFHSLSNTYEPKCLLSGSCARDLPSLLDSSHKVKAKLQAEVDVTYYLGVYAMLSILYLSIAFTREGLVFWGSLRASWGIHNKLLESVTRAKFKFFDSTPLGQLMNRFSKDLEAIDQEVAPVAVGFLGCLAAIISIVILITSITPGFLIAGIFITGLYLAIGTFYLRSSRDLKRLESVQRSPLYQQFGETISGLITIRAYRDERRFIRDNQHRVDTHNRPFIYLWAANRWLALRVDLVGALVAFFAGVFVILSLGKIDAGAAGLSLSYAVTFTENVLWLVRLYSINEQNMNSVERIKEYLDVEQEAKAVILEARPPGNWPSQGAIQFINYSTRYRSDLEPVLRNVTFSISPSERVGIVGRTGAGKSSLAMALFRGLEAQDGKILIDDIDIGLIGLQDLREAITIVPQDPTLFTGTIRSNLDPFDLFTDEEIFSTLRRVQLIGAALSDASSSPMTQPVVSLLTPPESSDSSQHNYDSDSELEHGKKSTNTRENTNVFMTLSSTISESGSNLSQGQRQLLCLARALLKSPRVLIMDEATASIDYTTDGKIQDTLREVKESTIITIAHRLQTIIDYDKVLVLDRGQVTEYGSPWELISKENGMFRGMCEMSGDFDALIEGAKNAADQRKLIDI